jgi:dephospho-CoA kinase
LNSSSNETAVPHSRQRCPPLRVGLTGNIASGKSTVASWLSALGCYVIDADELAHSSLAPGQPAHAAVVAELGSGLLTAAGTIDRRHLGRIVFADDSARHRLEEILHPEIRRREEELVERWASTADGGIAVTEAALLFETGSSGRYHRMVVVVAPDEVRLGRLVATGLSPGEAEQRMAAQMDQGEKAALADFVIDNGGDLRSTHGQVRRLHDALLRDSAALVAGERLPRSPSL